MADSGAEQKEKLANELSPDAAVQDNDPLDDSKAKFINGGNSLDDTRVEIAGSFSDTSFTGLGKDELKKYADDPFWVRLRWILFILFWVGWVAMLVAAIVIIILAPRCPFRPDLKWYHKDVAYNVYSKSFFDGDKSQDGYGDLEGIKKKEKYLDGRKANTIWLSSIIKTSGNDDHAVVDYKKLDGKFGTLDDFHAFCKKLAKSGKRVIMDLIPNQTSKNHTWFTKSQQKDGKYTNYYVWADAQGGRVPNNWVREDGNGQMWEFDSVRQQYYLSRFDGTADLNLTNADVMAEFKEIIQFWVGQGVSGFHVDGLEFLTENATLADEDASNSQTRNFADNAAVVHSLREIVNGLDNKPGREKVLFGTVTKANWDQLRMYYGKDGKGGLHMVSVVLDELTSRINAVDLQAKLEHYINVSNSNWLGWRLTTDEPGSTRVYDRVGDGRMVIAFALQALLPGSSLPYYGDEIAMVNGAQPQRRTESPMQWTNGPNAGFTVGTPWIPVNAGYKTKNLESMTAQLADNILMDSFKKLNELRGNESLQFGNTVFCSKNDLLMFGRNAPGFESYLVVANMGLTTAHKFAGIECVGSQKKGELVFHSHDEGHEDTKLDLQKAVHVNANEVLVIKMAA